MTHDTPLSHADEYVLNADEAYSLDDIYHAVWFVTEACPDGAKVVSALGMRICDYLRMAPEEVRGQVADELTELIRADVRRSLQ